MERYIILTRQIKGYSTYNNPIIISLILVTSDLEDIKVQINQGLFKDSAVIWDMSTQTRI